MPDMLKILAPLTLLAIVVLALWVVAQLLRRGGARSAPAPAAESPPFTRRELLSPAELLFFQSLEATLRHPTDAAGPPQLRIFAKVRLLDLLELPRSAANRQSWQNRVQSKHVDFVLCRAGDLRPELVIELDDASHDQPRRRDRDATVDAILGAAGLPVLHIRARAAYDRAEIAEQIRRTLAPST